MIEQAEFVVTQYRRKSRYSPYAIRLHRSDCRTLKESTLSWPWTPDQIPDRLCQICKPNPEENS